MSIIIKTCSASGGSAPYPRFGGLCSPNPPPGALPLDPAGGLPSPRPPIITSPAFQFPPGSSGSRRNTVCSEATECLPQNYAVLWRWLWLLHVRMNNTVTWICLKIKLSAVSGGRIGSGLILLRTELFVVYRSLWSTTLAFISSS